MTYLRKLGLPQLFSYVCGLLLALSSTSLFAAKLPAYFVVRWEGRALEEPNLEALDKLRKKFPDVPFVHLINPSYFKENAKISGDNFETIKKRILDNDEVGLYLLPSSNIVKAADVLPLRKPTFWNYSEELCSNDCGLTVPLTVYSRADVAKIFYTAASVMKEFGFTDLQSFAVHGYIHPAGVQQVAESLGFTNDLTAIDKDLLKDYLKEYPIGRWMASADSPSSTDALKAWTQAGGVMEFHNDDDVLTRFQKFFSSEQDKANGFIVSVSQESVFMNSLRLERTLQGMKDQAAARSDELAFDVFTKGKKGRPVAKNKGISRKS